MIYIFIRTFVVLDVLFLETKIKYFVVCSLRNKFLCFTELSKVKDPSLYGLKLTLQIFDYCTLTIFVLEIVLKWIDGFWTFWNNGWNIFDFVVTVMVSINKLVEIQLQGGEHYNNLNP